MELLTVYAWEQGCGAKDFNMAQGVKTVLRLIQQPKRLCVYWTVNYDFEDETIRNILLHQLQATGYRAPHALSWPLLPCPQPGAHAPSSAPVGWQLLWASV